jgi:hypothetical protein
MVGQEFASMAPSWLQFKEQISSAGGSLCFLQDENFARADDRLPLLCACMPYNRKPYKLEFGLAGSGVEPPV